jgi:hypothetical protein
LQKVELEGTKIIKEAAFLNCDFSTIKLPEGLNTIESYAFAGTSLVSITLPTTLLNIKENAFNVCNKLVEICNNSSLNITRDSTKYGQIGRLAINIYKEGVGSSIIFVEGDYIFCDSGADIYLLIDYTGKDKIIYLPESFKGNNYYINSYTFESKDTIEEVHIPASVLSLYNYAFYTCIFIGVVIV